ncbi:Lactonase, 7-bladed beta-propeller-domain-containing protein [Phakopsora pachyrhizi]|uniref:Lactonase, 7-bladed beta-propeller-domain-containing protein n=1 Tax=Phakopsora pachyrhizi TaxID=170000 RepID=A0AAV0BG05_PHAPC|nr:Lactonase, 7-bladed beta-propeller-domain-containing protein [Phakopsora pachyrhizi]
MYSKKLPFFIAVTGLLTALGNAMPKKEISLVQSSTGSDLNNGTAGGKKGVSGAGINVVIGTFVSRINTLRFEGGAFTNLSHVNSTGKKPEFVKPSADGKFLYTTNMVNDYDGKKSGSVSSLSITPSGEMAVISTVAVPIRPVALDISPDGKNLIVATFEGATAVYIPVGEGGKLDEKSVQLITYKGQGGSISSIFDAKFDSDGDVAFFTDRDADSVYVHKFDKKGKKLVEKPFIVKLPKGSGPRNVAVAGEKEVDLYINCEKTNKIFHARLTESGEGFEAKEAKEFPSLPSGKSDPMIFGGEIAVTKDGKFVYSSNRQTDEKKPLEDNTMVVYSRDPKTGELEKTPKFFPLGGSSPRHFSFSPDADQSKVIVAFQLSNGVSIFSRDSKDGSLKVEGTTSIKRATSAFFFPMGGEPGKTKEIKQSISAKSGENKGHD